MECVYCRSTAGRKKEFQVKTVIYVENGEKKVKKEALYPEGIGHIKNTYKNTELLRELYREKLSQTDMVGNCLISKFYNKQYSLGDKFREYILDENEPAIRDLLELWRSLIIGRSENICRFTQTCDFIKIFGNADGLEGEPSTRISNIDCNSENIFFLNDRDMKIIDYEWTFDFSIPIDFSLYYVLRDFYECSSDIITWKELLGYTNINNKEKIDIYEKMRTHFYNYICFDKETGIDYRQLGRQFLTAMYDSKDMIMTYKYLFPVDKIPKDSRVLIYGAGRVGTDYYRYVKETELYNLVGWSDKRADAYRAQNVKVQKIDDFKDIDFDYVVISVLHENVADEIRKELLKKNIPAEKIVWYKPELN